MIDAGTVAWTEKFLNVAIRKAKSEGAYSVTNHHCVMTDTEDPALPWKELARVPLMEALADGQIPLDLADFLCKAPGAVVAGGFVLRTLDAIKSERRRAPGDGSVPDPSSDELVPKKDIDVYFNGDVAGCGADFLLERTVTRKESTSSEMKKIRTYGINAFRRHQLRYRLYSDVFMDEVVSAVLERSIERLQTAYGKPRRWGDGGDGDGRVTYSEKCIREYLGLDEERSIGSLHRDFERGLSFADPYDKRIGAEDVGEIDFGGAVECTPSVAALLQRIEEIAEADARAVHASSGTRRVWYYLKGDIDFQVTKMLYFQILCSVFQIPRKHSDSYAKALIYATEGHNLWEFLEEVKDSGLKSFIASKITEKEPEPPMTHVMVRGRHMKVVLPDKAPKHTSIVPDKAYMCVSDGDEFKCLRTVTVVSAEASAPPPPKSDNDASTESYLSSTYKAVNNIARDGIKPWRKRENHVPQQYACAGATYDMIHTARMSPVDFVRKEFDLSVCKTIMRLVKRDGRRDPESESIAAIMGFDPYEYDIVFESLHPTDVEKKIVRFSFHPSMSANRYKTGAMLKRREKYCKKPGYCLVGSAEAIARLGDRPEAHISSKLAIDRLHCQHVQDVITLLVLDFVMFADTSVEQLDKAGIPRITIEKFREAVTVERACSFSTYGREPDREYVAWKDPELAPTGPYDPAIDEWPPSLKALREAGVNVVGDVTADVTRADGAADGDTLDDDAVDVTRADDVTFDDDVDDENDADNVVDDDAVDVTVDESALEDLLRENDMRKCDTRIYETPSSLNAKDMPSNSRGESLTCYGYAHSLFAKRQFFRAFVGTTGTPFSTSCTLRWGHAHHRMKVKDNYRKEVVQSVHDFLNTPRTERAQLIDEIIDDARRECETFYRDMYNSFETYEPYVRAALESEYFMFVGF